MTTDVVERLAYSPAEAAAAVGLSLATIYTLLKTGRLGHIKCERRILISRANLDAFLNQETAKRKGLLERIKGV